MQVGRLLNDDLRRFPLRDARVAIAPFSSHQRPTKSFGKMEEIRLDVMPHCARCGFPVCQNSKSVTKLLCQGCRRNELQRLGSLEDIRPASPMAGKPKALNSVTSWTAEVQTELETSQLSTVSSEHSRLFRVKSSPAAADSFRSMEVLTCFRSQVHRGLRLLLETVTAEKWHMWWTILLSVLLMPTILTLMLVAGVGVLVLSTWVVVACVVLYPLAYINPRLYNYAMDS